MTANADHYPFYQAGVPVVMLHTGLHEDYHRPGDVAAKINSEGLREVDRLLFALVFELANTSALPHYRAAARQETEDGRKRLETPDPMAAVLGGKPARLGIAWHADDAEPDSILISQVVPESPAARAGLRVGDRIYQICGKRFADDAKFAQLAKSLPEPIELLVERDGQLRVVTLRHATAKPLKHAA
jgi:C-terminal processing protease CtpA/Prc